MEKVTEGACPQGESSEKDTKEPDYLAGLSEEQGQRIVNSKLDVVWRAKMPYVMDRDFRRLMFQKYGIRQLGSMLKIAIAQWLKENRGGEK